MSPYVSVFVQSFLLCEIVLCMYKFVVFFSYLFLVSVSLIVFFSEVRIVKGYDMFVKVCEMFGGSLYLWKSTCFRKCVTCL